MAKLRNTICTCSHERFDHRRDSGTCTKCGCKKFDDTGVAKVKKRSRSKADADGLHPARRQLYEEITAAIDRFLKSIGVHLKSSVGKPSRKKTSFDSVGEIRAAMPTLTKAQGHSDSVMRAAGFDLTGKLGKGERKCMIVIAQHGNTGVTKAQLTQLTSYKRSTRNAYVARLRQAGFVSEGGGSVEAGFPNDRIVALPAGVAWLGSDYERLPVGDALYHYWCNKLGDSGEREILQLTRRSYPSSLEKTTIDTHLTMARSTRNAYCSRLKAKRLITEPTKGRIRMADELYGGAS